MAKEEKTNAMRLLESRKIAYTAHHYPAERMSAVEVAEHIGMPPGQVFKTLVVLPVVSRPRPLLAIIPGDRELDLKKAAAAVGEKKVRMATQNEAESLTRLQVGGISPLALLAGGFKMYLDSSAENYDQILVSAGQRGINLQVAVKDLVRVTRARLADLS